LETWTGLEGGVGEGSDERQFRFTDRLPSGELPLRERVMLDRVRRVERCHLVEITSLDSADQFLDD
jgi:hypothetical protein